MEFGNIDERPFELKSAGSAKAEEEANMLDTAASRRRSQVLKPIT